MSERPSTTVLFHQAADLAGDDFTPPTSAGFIQRRKHRRSTALAVTATVAVVATLAGVVAARGDGASDHARQAVGAPASSTAPVSEPPWLVFHGENGFTVDYSSYWVSSKLGAPSPGPSFTLATLGTMRVDQTCRPISGGATECGPVPERRLHGGDVVMTWSERSVIGGPGGGAVEPTSAGTSTTIDGKQARVSVTVGGTVEGECNVTLGSTEGSTRQVDVSIIEGNTDLFMTACMGGSDDQLDQAQADVLRSVQSVRLPGVPVAATSSTATPTSGLASPDYSGSGTAHGCGPDPSASVVTLTVNPDGLTPSLGCVQLSPGQRLRFVNNTNGFGQTGKTVTLAMRGLPTLTIPIGKSATYAEPIGSYLAAGQHYGTSTSEPGSHYDVWVLP
jgi:hypothetical protein